MVTMSNFPFHRNGNSPQLFYSSLHSLSPLSRGFLYSDSLSVLVKEACIIAWLFGGSEAHGCDL